MRNTFCKKYDIGDTVKLKGSGIIVTIERIDNEKDYNWYKYGNILPYYSQIRDFYEKNGVPVPDSDSVLQEHFEYHIGKAIDSILSRV